MVHPLPYRRRPLLPRLLVTASLALALGAACGVSKDKHAAVEKDLKAAKEKLEKRSLEAKKAEERLRVLQGDAKKAEERARAAEERATKEKEAQEALKKDFGARLKASEKEVEALAKARLEAEEQSKLLTKVTGQLEPLIKKRQISLTLVHGRMVIKLRSRVLFASNSAKLLAYGKRALSQVAKVLKDVKGSHFQVAGHTDNVAIKKGDFKDNWELSTARALTVLKFLQEQGLPGDSLSAAGFAEFQPVARNKSTWGRQKNRRIEITLLPQVTRALLEGPPKGGKGRKGGKRAKRRK